MSFVNTIGRRRMLGSAGAILTAPFLSRGASAAQVMKLGHVMPASHHVNLTSLKLAQEVKDRTKGAIEIRVFPAGQLGQEREMFESVQLGSLQMGCLGGNAIESFEPSEGLFSLPYLFNSDADAFKVADGPVGKEIGDRVLAKTGVRYLAYGHVGLRSTLSRNKAIHSVADFVGLKVRVPPSPSYVSAFALLGASPTPIPGGEMYTALQMGVVDASEGTAATLNDFKLFEIAKYFSLTRHIYTDLPIVISEKVWKQLSPEYQAIFTEATHNAVLYERQIAAEQDRAVLESATKSGLMVNEVDTAPMREKVQPYYQEFAKKIGGPQLIDAALAAMKPA
jgi:TRAP-type transport system periplasmic protein